ncbi:hypothetical protein OJ253_2953 [Cryptosporidium canis]|uniref:Pre-mRNA-splicing factor CWC2 n=1 Tax=Cryptosporidium canis TaxID=195482 RepID=A0A9D5HXR4_9CRYT|nr:hypothetical protein OJ253_2953 [Cryptosporidium canis]
MGKVPAEFKRRPTVEELGRPARVQSDGSLQSNLAYKEGGELYNIWYGKYQFDYDKRGKVASKTKCIPENDSGWTRADQDLEAKSHFCLYFAKGACVNGSKCKYFHRIPTEEDDSQVSPMYDVFGRERHAQHKDDMSGTGSFNKECRTVFVGDLYINRSKANYLEGVSKIIKKEFSVWGPVDNIRVIPSKNIAFVRYFLRSSAEFAKAAMENQIIFKGQTEPITVRWAYDDPNPTSMENNRKRNTEEVEEAVSRLDSEKKPKPDTQVESEMEGFFSHLDNVNYSSVPTDEVAKVQKDYHRVGRILESIKTSQTQEQQKTKDNSIYDVTL